MLKKILPLLIFALLSNNFYAQEKFVDIPNSLKQGIRSVKDAFSVVNEDGKTFAVFIDDNKTLNGYLYNYDLTPIASYASEGLPNRYDEIIGQTIEGNQMKLFLKSSNNKKFGSILFDFDNSTSVETQFDFKLRNDRFLQSYSKDGEFYIFTVDKRSSILNTYVFNHSGEYSKESFDLSDRPFRDDRNVPCTLDDLIVENAGFNKIVTLAKIDETTPNAIDVTSNTTKIFERENGIVLTLDKGKVYTYIIELKVPDMQVDFQAVSKPQLLVNGEFDKSNSYLYGDKLFQITGNQKEMRFQVMDLNTEKILKKLYLEKDGDIAFKNSPIIQEGGTYSPNRVREMEKTSKFLRKISADDIGLAVIPNESGYQITMGGNKRLTSGGGAMAMPGFGVPIATAGAVTFYFNPVYFAYSSYSGSKSTRIECLFDENFEHIEGDVPRNVFDDIKSFADNVSDPRAENVFKLGDFYIYGSYNTNNHVYELTKFE